MILAILFFMAYSVVVFLSPNWIWLTAFSGFNILLCIVFKTGFSKTIKNIFGITLFATFVFLINLIFLDLVSCLLTAWKLIVVCNFTFIFGKIFKPSMIASGFSQLLFPLKIFKVDTQAISLMIVIALEFVPILSISAKNLQKTLKAKGFKLNLKNMVTQGHHIFALFFLEIFKRVEILEKAIIARGYNSK